MFSCWTTGHSTQGLGYWSWVAGFRTSLNFCPSSVCKEQQCLGPPLMSLRVKLSTRAASVPYMTCSKEIPICRGACCALPQGIWKSLELQSFHGEELLLLTNSLLGTGRPCSPAPQGKMESGVILRIRNPASGKHVPSCSGLKPHSSATFKSLRGGPSALRELPVCDRRQPFCS